MKYIITWVLVQLVASRNPNMTYNFDRTEVERSAIFINKEDADIYLELKMKEQSAFPMLNSNNHYEFLYKVKIDSTNENSN